MSHRSCHDAGVKTVILAGGRGTRLSEETEVTPKPMVEVGGRPILWHIMSTYAHFGHTEFVLALGYRSEVVKRFFLDYPRLQGGMTVDLASGDVQMHAPCPDDWTVHLVETGLLTETGGRLRKLASMIGDQRFLMTYGDGLASVDINAVLDFHVSHGKLATIVAARPPARFGGLSFDGEQVTEFVEKPQLGEGWINGGFFVLEPGVLDYIDGDATLFEREPLEALAKDRQLMAFRHDGFWQCMDTLRDVRLLNSLWESGDAPWRH